MENVKIKIYLIYSKIKKLLYLVFQVHLHQLAPNHIYLVKGVKDIYCLSVNDKFVLSAWLNSYEYGYKIKGIADGNAELTQMLNLLNDKRSSFMGFRCTRFAMIINNNFITNFFVEESGGFDQTSAENILLNL